MVDADDIKRNMEALTLGLNSLLTEADQKGADVAMALGKNKSQISKWMRTSGVPAHHGRPEWFIAAFCVHFGVRPSELYARGERIQLQQELEASRARAAKLRREPELAAVIESLGHLDEADRQAVRDAIYDIDGPEDS